MGRRPNTSSVFLAHSQSTSSLWSSWQAKKRRGEGPGDKVALPVFQSPFALTKNSLEETEIVFFGATKFCSILRRLWLSFLNFLILIEVTEIHIHCFVFEQQNAFHIFSPESIFSSSENLFILIWIAC